MKTVSEVSRMTGVSVRTLQYYDRIGLLPPAAHTESGYRLYDSETLARLSQILLFRELDFSLAEIRQILNAPDFDRNQALRRQIELLELKKAHLENMILFAKGIEMKGVDQMDLSMIDRTKLDEYAKRARAEWGSTPQYAESQEKTQGRTEAEEQTLVRDMMRIFTEFGALRTQSPDAPEVQRQVSRLQEFITAHWYHCTDAILSGLGKMYSAGGEFTENIDAAGGEGTADFVGRAIAVYCGHSM